MKLLFICTHNRCRSILAEAITNHLSAGRIIAVSAGSSPQAEVHPLSLKYLAERNIKIKGLRSQSWNEHSSFSPDAIITMCDKAAQESCPVWFDHSVQVDWSITDPSSSTNHGVSQDESFRHTIGIIEQRVRRLLDQDLAHLQGAALKQQLNNIALEIA